MAPAAVGVDLGGTKIEAVVLVDGDERGRRRVPTPRGDYIQTIETIAMLVESLERDAGVVATVGVGIPGTVVPATGLVKNANSTWLIGRPFPADLARRLGRPVHVANDANCFALSEARDGAATGASVVFGVILGTGVGGGLVVNGQVLTGPNGLAGEWGHNPLPWVGADEWPGPDCYCGKRGCIETFLSGPGLAADHFRVTGETLTADVIVARAMAGVASADHTLRRYEHRLARALGGLINVLDPDVIVLGGGLSNIERLYTSIPAQWGAAVFGCDRQPGQAVPAASPVRTSLRRAQHGDASGVRGAAWLGAVN